MEEVEDEEEEEEGLAEVKDTVLCIREDIVIYRFEKKGREEDGGGDSRISLLLFFHLSH